MLVSSCSTSLNSEWRDAPGMDCIGAVFSIIVVPVNLCVPFISNTKMSIQLVAVDSNFSCLIV